MPIKIENLEKYRRPGIFTREVDIAIVDHIGILGNHNIARNARGYLGDMRDPREFIRIYGLPDSPKDHDIVRVYSELDPYGEEWWD